MFSDQLNLPLRSRYTYTIIAPFLIALAVIWLAFDSSGQDASLDSIDDAEQAWASLGIEDYQLVVQEIGVWEVTRTRSHVSDGQVVAMYGTCDRGLVGMPCQVTTLDPERATIPSLLAYARDVAAFEERAKWLKVDVQTEDGFVLSMSFNDPELLDEDWGLTARVEVDESGDTTGAQPEVPTPATPEEPEITPTPETPPSDTVIAWIDQHEKAWNALEIADYQIEMQVESASGLLTVHLELTDNRVTVAAVQCDTEEVSVPPEECIFPRLFTRDYRMSGIEGYGLFVQARDAVDLYDGPENVVEMHPDYHFPMVIRFDDPAVADDEWTLTVTAFQPLPESDQ